MTRNDLLYSIVLCEELEKGVSNSAYYGPCKEIIHVQDQDFEEFQGPEPWNGHIDTAPLLFIGPNPSISQTERYPDRNWGKNDIKGFFEDRFDGNWSWKFKCLQKDGSYPSQPVRFWVSVRARTAELFGKDKDQIIPGLDFALTEVVHCKSRNSIGVKAALEFCSNKFLYEVLSQSVARVVLLMGDEAAKGFRKVFHKELLGHEVKRMIGPIDIFGRKRYIVFLPHPNQKGKLKTLEKNLSPKLFKELKDWFCNE